VNLPGTQDIPAPPGPTPTPPSASPSSQNVTACDGKSTSVLISGGVAPYSISAQPTTVNSTLVTPVAPSPLAAPGFELITLPFQPGGLPTPVNTTYNFVVADSSTPQQTDTFKVVCK
ncbi:MAG: hypothetical protein ACREYB_13030, partial [Casimicrobiaceae bacterium]